jgi:uncharacterized protein YqjF (DUF2071 family)
MLNFAVEPALLASRVPDGTELDAWGGKTFLSVVGFLFLDTRVLGVPIPFHRDFEEVNLRFYVRRGEKRGVVFVKEIVPRFAIAAVARALYGESYVALPMRHGCEMGERGGRVEYGWRTGERWHSLSVRAEGAPRLAEPGSEAEFVTEHYWGYAGRPGRGTVEYEVEHPRWNIWPAAEASLDIDAARLYGDDLAAPLAARPTSAFLCEGSPILVRRGVAL